MPGRAGTLWHRLRARRRAPAVVVLAVAFAAVALSACNSSDNVVVSTTVVPPPPGCDNQRVIVIGASLDLSGPSASLGHEWLTGLEMGIAKVNAGNGVPPRNSCFMLMYKDNQGSTAIDNQALLDLVNVEKSGIVVSQFLGASTADWLGRLGIASVGLSTNSATFEPKNYPNTFPMTASMPSQASVMGSTLKKGKVTSVGLIVTDDPASRQGAEHLASLSAPDGFTIVAQASVPTNGDGAAGALDRVRASHPSELVVMDDAMAVGPVLTARAQMGWEVPVLAGPNSTQTNIVTTLSPVATRGVSVVVPVGAVVRTGPAGQASLAFRHELMTELGSAQLSGSIIPYAQTYDAMTMMGSAGNGAMGTVASYITTYLENANYQGVLASYTYTSGQHTGVSTTNQEVVALDSLKNGLLKPPPKTK